MVRRSTKAAGVDTFPTSSGMLGEAPKAPVDTTQKDKLHGTTLAAADPPTILTAEEPTSLESTTASYIDVCVQLQRMIKDQSEL